MNRRYLVLDSAYRDRYLYSSASDYVIPFQKSIGNTIENSTNAITNAYPIDNFCFLSGIGSGFTVSVVGGTSSAPQVDLSQINEYTGIGLADTSTTVTQAENIFQNLSLLFTTGGITYTTFFQILFYDSINGIFTLSASIPNFTTVDSSVTIVNTSVGYVPSTDTSTTPSIVLQGYNTISLGPNSNTDGFFISSTSTLFLTDMTLLEVVSCTYNNLVSVNLATSFSSDWNVTDKYMFHINQSPSDIGRIYLQTLPDGTTAYYLQNTIVSFTFTGNGRGYSLNQEVYLYPYYVTSAVNLNDIARAVVSGINADGSIRDLLITYYGQNYTFQQQVVITPVSSSVAEQATLLIQEIGAAFLIESSSSASSGSYLGQYFFGFLMGSGYSSTKTQNNGTTIDGIFQSPNNSLPPPFSALDPSQIDNINTLYQSDSWYATFPILKAIPTTTAGQTLIFCQGVPGNLLARYKQVLVTPPDWPVNEYLGYEVFPYVKDSVSPLDFSGTQVSSNQAVCYQMSLQSLIIPNQTLALAFGGLTSSYPYILVQISNDTNQNLNLIYSNNPNVNTATFMCSISDVQSPVISKFLKLSGDGTSQIVKFKPNDNLRVRIIMPDGSLFQTTIQDYMPPLPVNTLVQTVAHVEITRI